MITLVYVELSYGLMRVVIFDKNREKYYVRVRHESILESTAYLHGVIYNLSSLIAAFQKIAQRYALENLPVVLSVEKENVLNILQIVLSFAKSGLKLYKVRCRALINWEKSMKYASFLMVDAFYHQSTYFKDFLLSIRELRQWWYPSGFVIVLLAIMAAIGHPSKKIELLAKKEQDATHRNEVIKDALHGYEMLRDMYKHIDKQTPTPPIFKNPPMSVIMRSLSLTVRKKTWIKSVSVKKKSAPAVTHVHVEGKTLLQEEITYFKQDFERLVLHSQITLKTLEVEGQGVSTFACSGVLHT